MGSLRADEGRLAVSLSELQQVATASAPGDVVALGERLLKLWPRMNAEQRNRALRDIIDRVEIAPGTRYRQPADERVTVFWR
jgi:hypothetical protein